MKRLMKHMTGSWGKEGEEEEGMAEMISSQTDSPSSFAASSVVTELEGIVRW